MKKLLGAVLALAMLYWCPIASADLLKNFKTTGGIDVQAVSVNNLMDLFNSGTIGKDIDEDAAAPSNTNDQIGQANTRIWVGASMDPADDVHAKVTVYKAGRGYGNAEDDGDDIQTAIQVGEANVKVDLKETCSFTLGRQFYGNAGDLAIYFGPSGSAHWQLPVSSLDIFRADHSNDWFSMTGIVGKVGAPVGAATPGPGTGTTAAAVNVAGDVDVRGLDLGWKLPVEGLSANTYWYNRVIHAAGAVGSSPANDYLNNLGLKAKWMGGGLSAGAHIVVNNGQNRLDPDGAGPLIAPAVPSNYRGFAHMWDVGYKHEMMGTWNFGAQYGFGTGDDANATGTPTTHQEGFVAINTDYRPGNIWGRFPSAIGALVRDSDGNDLLASPEALDGPNGAGLNNLVTWNIGVDYSPEGWEKLTAGIRYYDFSRQRKPIDDDTATNDISKKLGSEIDLTLGWKHSDNVWVGAGVAKFYPGAFFTSAAAAGEFGQIGGGGFNQVTLFHADFKVMF